MKNILLLMTGGTICSFAEGNTRSLNTSDAERLLIKNYTDSNDTSGIHFTTSVCLDVLSENMDIEKWNALIAFFKNCGYENYDGVIITHGTDTLAYTAALFSVLLKGIKIPVVFVSANAPLNNPVSNGNANFKEAVNGILNDEIPNGVWAVYQNISDGKMQIHNGLEIIQCPNYSDDFKSIKSIITPVKTDMLINKLDRISAKILYITPYVGIDYNLYDTKNVRAVLHGAYHSGTVESHSFLEFSKRCREQGIPVFISPCNYKDGEVYSTVHEALSGGALTLFGTTTEVSYAKMLVAFSMYNNEDAIKFLTSDNF